MLVGRFSLCKELVASQGSPIPPHAKNRLSTGGFRVIA